MYCRVRPLKVYRSVVLVSLQSGAAITTISSGTSVLLARAGGPQAVCLPGPERHPSVRPLQPVGARELPGGRGGMSPTTTALSLIAGVTARRS